MAHRLAQRKHSKSAGHCERPAAVKDGAKTTIPFQIARETAGDRPIPSWLQVVGERQRILIHQLPERAQIDVPLTEQLIVEYYSK